MSNDTFVWPENTPIRKVIFHHVNTTTSIENYVTYKEVRRALANQGVALLTITGSDVCDVTEVDVDVPASDDLAAKLEKEYNERLDDAYSLFSKEKEEAEKVAEEGYRQAYDIISNLRDKLENQKKEIVELQKEDDAPPDIEGKPLKWKPLKEHWNPAMEEFCKYKEPADLGPEWLEEMRKMEGIEIEIEK